MPLGPGFPPQRAGGAPAPPPTAHRAPGTRGPWGAQRQGWADHTVPQADRKWEPTCTGGQPLAVGDRGWWWAHPASGSQPLVTWQGLHVTSRSRLPTAAPPHPCSPRAASCRGRRRCTPARRQHCASTASCWSCGSWCSRGQLGGTRTVERGRRRGWVSHRPPGGPRGPGGRCLGAKVGRSARAFPHR